MCRIPLTHELTKRGLSVRQHVSVPIVFDDMMPDANLRLHMLINEAVIVELKTVDCLLPFHRAQVLTCLELTGQRLVLLISFIAALIRDGIERFAL